MKFKDFIESKIVISTRDIQNELFKRLEHATKTNNLDRRSEIAEVQKYTGLKIFDVGNTQNYEIAYALQRLLAQHVNSGFSANEKLPQGIKNVIIGHGHGPINDWKFDGNNQSVIKFINANIPSGEKAYCIICDKDRKENFVTASGKIITSGQNLN